MLVKKIKEFIGSEEQLFTLFIDRLSDVTLLSPGSWRKYSIRSSMRTVNQSMNGEIRYSGIEKTQKDGLKLTSPNG